MLGDAAGDRLAWAVLVALLARKFLGVIGTIVVAVGGRFGRLPVGVSFGHVPGLRWIAGRGFTVALFVAELAYTGPETVEHTKIRVLGVSLLAAVAASGHCAPPLTGHGEPIASSRVTDRHHTDSIKSPAW
ncbi:Na+/H+ antiporter NhaA [Nocardia sp. NPDC052278]|uniref:Na+/H+ antiporter NhaA n=1 Tax=unclassified Nocardia TaxID=2637762 RepID=UPI00367E8C0B